MTARQQGSGPQQPGAPETADASAQAAPVTPPPDDIDELREEIERTREQLGETVEQLAAKADVAGRAKAKAAEVTERVKATAAASASKAAGAVHTARDQAADAVGAARDQAAEVGQTTAAAAGSGTTQVKDQATAAWAALPEPVRTMTAKGATAARQRPVPVAAGLAAALVVVLAVRKWRKH